MYSISNVHMTCGGKKIIEEINMALEKGKVVGLFDQGEKGKSALLQLLAYQLIPDSGSILFDGLPMTPSSRGKIVYLSQQSSVSITMTIQNLLDYYQLFFVDFSIVDFEKYCREARLTLANNRRLSQFTASEQQLIRIIFSLSRRAQVYLFDEPMMSLSVNFQGIARALIQTRIDENTLIVMASKDLTGITYLIEDLAIISNAQLIRYDNCDDLRTAYGESLDSIICHLLKEDICRN